MTKDELIEKINQLLVEEFEADTELIKADASLKETLELDSLDMIDVVVMVEQHFGLTLKPEDFASIKTFQDFYDIIDSHMNESEK